MTAGKDRQLIWKAAMAIPHGTKCACASCELARLRAENVRLRLALQEARSGLFGVRAKSDDHINWIDDALNSEGK